MSNQFCKCGHHIKLHVRDGSCTTCLCRFYTEPGGRPLESTPVVKLSFGERFLNWYAKDTKLYIRGQQGKDWDTQRALDRELAKQLNEWFASLDEIKELKARREEDWPWND